MTEPDTHSALRARLATLESLAGTLESDAPTRNANLMEAARYTERYLHSLTEQAVYQPPAGSDSTPDSLSFNDEPMSARDALALIREHVDNTGLHTGSERFFGYIPSGALYEAALGGQKYSYTPAK